jgi:hypothetical protein
MNCFERFSRQLSNDGIESDDLKSIQDNAHKLYSEILGSLSNPNDKLGLLFGQVQSGKTNNIIMSIAHAIDNGKKLFIVMTSDNTWLYGQTLNRVQAGLRSIGVFGKDDWRNESTKDRIQTAYSSKAVVFVTSKNRTILESLTSFVCGMIQHTESAIIFDDEADQASLDTNANRDDVAPSAINSSIQQLRSYFDNHVFVQVTATPQSLFLQCAGNGFRPDFVVPFKPGRQYLGGEFFFGENLSNGPIRLIPETEPQTIIDNTSIQFGLGCPTGVRQSLCSFFIAASIKYIEGEDKPFACLIHISHKQGVHQVLHSLVNSFLVEMIKGLTTDEVLRPIALQYLQEAYSDYVRTLQAIPSFEEVLEFIVSDINSTNVQILNSDNPELPQICTTFNVLIGGNRLGRGVTIGRLLVTYYGRSAKSPQIDTVLQHARMYGYRRNDKDFLRFFTTSTLYGLFSNIHESDSLLREMVFDKTPNNLHAILLNRTHNTNLRPTRNNVIPLDQISLFLPGTRYFPYTPVNSNVDLLNTMLMPFVDKKKPLQVEIDFLIDIMHLVKSEKISGESWDDEAIRVCLKNMKEKYNNTGYLFARIDRDIKQGARAMLSEDDSKQYIGDYPTLTMYRYLGSKDKGWDGQQIWVPNIRFPDGNNFFMYTPS